MLTELLHFVLSVERAVQLDIPRAEVVRLVVKFDRQAATVENAFELVFDLGSRRRIARLSLAPCQVALIPEPYNKLELDAEIVSTGHDPLRWMCLRTCLNVARHFQTKE